MSGLPSRRCPWCLRDTTHPVDIQNSYCACCGSDEVPLVKTCEHRTGQTLDQLWAAGVRLVRRDPWADGNYLELQATGPDERFYSALAVVHSPLEWDGDVVPEGSDIRAAQRPPDLALSAQTVPLWATPKGGWEAYTGPTVAQRREALDGETTST